MLEVAVAASSYGTRSESQRSTCPSWVCHPNKFIPAKAKWSKSVLPDIGGDTDVEVISRFYVKGLATKLRMEKQADNPWNRLKPLLDVPRLKAVSSKKLKVRLGDKVSKGKLSPLLLGDYAVQKATAPAEKTSSKADCKHPLKPTVAQASQLRRLPPYLTIPFSGWFRVKVAKAIAFRHQCVALPVNLGLIRPKWRGQVLKSVYWRKSSIHCKIRVIFGPKSH